MTGFVVERTAREIVLSDEHRRVTAYIVQLGTALGINFAVCGGSVPPQVRSGVVSAVFDLPELRGGAALHVTVPLGDAELLEALRRRCVELVIHPAGVTCLIDAHVRE